MMSSEFFAVSATEGTQTVPALELTIKVLEIIRILLFYNDFKKICKCLNSTKAYTMVLLEC